MEGAFVPAYPFNDVPGTSGPGKFVEVRLRIRLQPGVSDRHSPGILTPES